MALHSKKQPQEKTGLHPRNKHRGRYDFDALIQSSPELAAFVKPNKYGNKSVNFFDPQAVKRLNAALLKHHYNIDFWDIPKNYLCPPIPGRADYIHNIADLLALRNTSTTPRGKQIKCLDVGVGANCVYPIIGVSTYGWYFVGCDIDATAIASATKIVENNATLKHHVTLRLQQTPKHIFEGVIATDELFDVTLCNPPFHTSAEEAQAGSVRKIKNLTKKSATTPLLNFGGTHNELWCKGGEATFIKDMIFESRRFKTQCFWFTTLVSKASNLKGVYRTLKKVQVAEVKTLEMHQGQKTSRIVAWTFLDKAQQHNWRRS